MEDLVMAPGHESKRDPKRDRRRHRRAPAMIPALLDQCPVTITDISLGGIGSGALELLADNEFLPEQGQRASLRFLDGGEFSENIEIEVIRVSNEKGRLGARYVGLTSEQKRLIEGLVKSQCDSAA